MSVSVAKLSEEITTEKETKLAKLDEMMRDMDAECEEYKIFKENRQIYVTERDLWKQKRDNQRVQHEDKLNKIEDDKIEQIDMLRKDMLGKIRAVKVKMLNMNEDHLVGTTKLTVI